MTEPRSTATRRGASPRGAALTAFLGALALLGLTACSSDDDSVSAPPSPASTADGTASSAATTTTPVVRQPGAITETSQAAGAAETTEPVASTTTTPAAPPTAGDIAEAVEALPVQTLAAVSLDQEVEVPGAAVVRIVDIDQVDAEARLPGEIAGPALAISVVVENTTDAALDLTGVTVNLIDGADAVSSPLTAEPASPLEGRLAPGDSAEGVYLFDFGAERVQPITLEVSPVVGAPIAVFVGNPN